MPWHSDKTGKQVDFGRILYDIRYGYGERNYKRKIHDQVSRLLSIQSSKCEIYTWLNATDLVRHTDSSDV